MLDLSFLDKVNAEELTPEDKKNNELDQLAALASYVGSYTYQYKGCEKYHDGIIAQELLQVPGLRDAIKKGEDGSLTVDTQMVSLATLGYVAALVRLILNAAPNTSRPEDVQEQEAILEEKPVDGMNAGDLIDGTN